jgi:hypothetical protein
MLKVARLTPVITRVQQKLADLGEACTTTSRNQQKTPTGDVKESPRQHQKQPQLLSTAPPYAVSSSRSINSVGHRSGCSTPYDERKV